MIEVLVFVSDVCGHCKEVEMTFESLEKILDDVKIRIINIDDHPGTGSVYDINELPTAVILKDGIERQRLIGNHTQMAYTLAIRELD